MRRERFLKIAAGALLAPWLAKVPAAPAAPATAELAASSAYLRAGDIVRLTTTGEAFRVTAVGSRSVTVTRALSGGGERLAERSDLLRLVARACAEGSEM